MKMRIAIGADHGGFELKLALVAAFPEVEFTDVGTFAADSCDYPDFADAVAEAVAAGEADLACWCAPRAWECPRPSRLRALPTR